MNSILDEVLLKYQTLSKTEKKVADYVINNSQHMLNIHIKDLASRIQVSVATITRFCKKVGVSNFVEFKILLRDAVEQTVESDEVIDIAAQVYHSVIKSTHSIATMNDYERVSNWIQQANRIHIYGIGSSGLSAEELKIRLTRMGYSVDTHTDSHAMVINASILTKSDVVIAISSSGQTKEVIDSVHIAKSKGAKIVSITNFSETNLAHQSDAILYTTSIQHYQAKGFMNSQLSILICLDILSMMLLTDEQAHATYNQTLAKLEEYKKI
ncbi:MurR/RpiR family transcriptional regulator [Virgibacillus chiguensis]|uniref:DNA-binding transcriptional regulator, MurR/RpiR family, contains HTH and SIS domains n=1 Tax=Virgibacillus chiguensis TaxID=411959 RepID=A0A1M5UCX0_9BACI|nr:MurR/RpiR family transcriptional regulator [Virgibacillus chiguensis]SHH60807.1 DNA-binding transcriptional regulator, MurR/RpiR family, contains HTH and SIS domains [Virgibacillus chiguensis]